jgi:hypothetical protein
MPLRPSMQKLLMAARVQDAIAARHAVEEATRSATQEARARSLLYPERRLEGRATPQEPPR